MDEASTRRVMSDEIREDVGQGRIRGQELALVPSSGQPGKMEDRVDARCGLSDDPGVAEIPFDDLDALGSPIPRDAAGTSDDADIEVRVGEEAIDEVAADETRCPCDQDTRLAGFGSIVS